jgi:radical SAM superfamily enzyme YgiQ (UPF0313 family)
MKILLIASTPYREDGSLLKQSRLWLPGLTLPQIAALTPDDIEIELINETIQDIPWETDANLVGVSGMGVGLIRAIQIADEFRRRGKQVVMGGMMATLAAEQCLEHCDSLVFGEAEGIWSQVVNDARLGRLEKTYKAAELDDLSDLPVPRFDLIPKKKIGFWLPVQAGRGCPYHCDFCSITSFYNGVYRTRPLDQVARDIEAIITLGIHKILLLDDNIGADPVFATDLFRMLKEFKIQWMTQCSLTIARRPDLLNLAAESGCVCMSFGLETIKQSNLATVNKSFLNVDEYESAIKEIRSAGIDVSTEMMLGMDEDDPDVFEETIDFLVRNRISVARLYIITPIPGTPLYERWKVQGRIFEDDWSRYTGGNVVFHPKKMSAQELQEKYWLTYERLYSLGNLFKRFFLKKRIKGFLIPLFFLGANFQYRRHISQRICPGIV